MNGGMPHLKSLASSRRPSLSDQDMNITYTSENDVEIGQIVTTTINGHNGQPKQTVSYKAELMVGTGTFGAVFLAKCLETGELVAIKKVLQDKRFKNRELQIMCLLNHPQVVQLQNYFYSTTEKDEVYLNLVLEFVPETVYQVLNHYKYGRHMPTLYVQLYTYQICRALNYIHNVIGVCHRDIKPQNMLVNSHTHELKLCDFGSAKKLVPVNLTYHTYAQGITSSRADIRATEYTSAIDMWSVGCVLAELFLGQPLFPGKSSVDQLVQIIKVLGTPTREEIKCMNPHYSEFKFPQIKPCPWHKVFNKRVPVEAVDLMSRLLQYSPSLRCTALEACAHPFFDDLRNPDARFPDGRSMSHLLDFTPEELANASPETHQCLQPRSVQPE